MSGFGQVLKSDSHLRVFGLRPNTCWPVADEMKLPVAREKKPLVPRVRLSGHCSIFGFVFFCAQVSCAMGIARQGSLENFAILTLKPRSHAKILNIYRTWVISKQILHITNYLQLGDSGAIG